MNAADVSIPETSAQTDGQRRSRRTFPAGKVRRDTLLGWLFVLPALVSYGVFVLFPVAMSINYSLNRWDGFNVPKWVGLDNYIAVLTDPNLVNTLFNSFRLIFFFTVIPVVLGLVVAAVIRGSATGKLGYVARTVLFLPQVIPLVAAGIVWTVVLQTNGLFNQFLTAIGLGGIAQSWLSSFDWALVAVGAIGAWVLLGLCTLLLVTGMSKIDKTLYEAARIDGAGAFREFFAITLPSLKQELAVCITVTVIAALRSFDIVYISTQGGPGGTTMVPGMQIYLSTFYGRSVGTASALSVVLIVTILILILPIQWLSRETGE